MASVRFLLVCVLFALPARAQLLGQPDPHFELRADPPSPRAKVVAGYLPAARNSKQAARIGHRYFYDVAAHTYYGYDIVIQPEQQGDGYRVIFYDLSIGPLDFSDVPSDALDPTVWKKLPLSALPAPHTIKASEALENVVSVDPSTGQKLIDSITILPVLTAFSSPTVGSTQQFQVLTLQPATGPTVIDTTNILPVPQPASLPPAIGNTQQIQIQFRSPNGSSQMRYYFSSTGASPEGSPAPTVSGTARDFSVDDVEMRIQRPRVTINDVRQQLPSPSRVANGSLVWFYAPQHGRYVLSLSPRPELGFVKAGEVRGGTVTFTIGDDRVQLESPMTIAPGDAPYLLYVLHDRDWEPTSDPQIGTLLFGSVSPRELAALSRK